MTIQSTQQRTEIVLNLGELRAAQRDDTALVCLGLGSCVGLCAYDPVARVGGMAHAGVAMRRRLRRPAETGDMVTRA